MALPPWKLNLQPASYKGIVFHVDVDTRQGGRRTVLHEFPKKDTPYTEDMGRRGRHFSISGYLIGPNFQITRDQLVAQLEAEGAGDLVHPTYQVPGQVIVDTYSMTEHRERGGWVDFEIMFIEAGQALDQQTTQDTASASNSAVDSMVPTSSSNFGNDFSGSSDISQLT